jgi:hypothetical protein
MTVLPTGLFLQGVADAQALAAAEALDPPEEPGVEKQQGAGTAKGGYNGNDKTAGTR